MPARRKKQRVSLLRRVAGALADLVDACFRALGDGFAALVHLLGRLIFLIFRLLLFLLKKIFFCLSCPISALIRIIRGKNNSASRCLKLSGEAFEEYAADVLADNGFKHVQLTPASGDQGVDILCERGGRRYAIQCKNYQGAVGNFAVQEAYAGMQYYGCDVAVVLCPGTFTQSARQLAESTGVLLWGERRLTHMMQISGRRP